MLVLVAVNWWIASSQVRQRQLGRFEERAAEQCRLMTADAALVVEPRRKLESRRSPQAGQRKPCGQRALYKARWALASVPYAGAVRWTNSTIDRPSAATALD